MQIIRKKALQRSERHLVNNVYETTRFLLAEDGPGVTVTDIVLAPGVRQVYGYAHNTEIAYCIEGEATLTDSANGSVHAIVPGTMWVASPGEQFEAAAATRLICVFTPALEGGETGFAPGAREEP